MSPANQTPADHAPEIVVVDTVWPDQANHHGTLFGGAALSMLDRLAFIVASKTLRGSVVTAAVRDLHFSAPAPIGHLVESRARVTHRGRRSVTVGTQLIAEDMLSGERAVCLSGEFVMVRQADDEAVKTTSDHAPPSTDSGSVVTERSCASVAEIVFPGHVNHRGILHGGPAMAWLAKAGFVAATREVRRPVVMAGSERLDFKASAYVGDLVDVTARVISTGRRSINVLAEMWAESSTSGERRHCISTKLVYVSLET